MKTLNISITNKVALNSIVRKCASEIKDFVRYCTGKDLDVEINEVDSMLKDTKGLNKEIQNSNKKMDIYIIKAQNFNKLAESYIKSLNKYLGILN